MQAGTAGHDNLMIEFTCSGCGRSFNVPDAYAGRSARCKGCGATVSVPPAAAPMTPPAAARPGVRFRRLTADARQIAQAFSQFSLIKIIQTQGDPPDLFRIEYHIQGLDRGPDGKPVRRDRHEVEIQLTADYPRLAPKCRMLTPTFHPNIDTSTICVGDHWTAGERLVDLIIRIGEMIAYQAYNIRSPLDGEAAMWADLHAAELPIDPSNLHPPAL